MFPCAIKTIYEKTNVTNIKRIAINNDCSWNIVYSTVTFKSVLGAMMFGFHVVNSYFFYKVGINMIQRKIYFEFYVKSI